MLQDIIGRIAFEHNVKLKRFVDFQRFLLEVTTVAYRMLGAANELNEKLRRKIQRCGSSTYNEGPFSRIAYPRIY